MIWRSGNLKSRDQIVCFANTRTGIFADYQGHFVAETAARALPERVLHSPHSMPLRSDYVKSASQTVDEELTLLEDQLRKLKIEYDSYFGGGKKRPPAETEWKVKSLLVKYTDANISIAQRFRYNALAHRYAIFSDLWRQKAKVREEGYRRPQDALLGIVGLRTEQEHAAARQLHASAGAGEPFVLECSDARRQQREVRRLYEELLAARSRNGETMPDNGFESFLSFVDRKTGEMRESRHCAAVKFWVTSEDGRAKLKLQPKKK